MSFSGKGGNIYIGGGTKTEWSIQPGATGFEWSKDSLLASERQAILDDFEELVTKVDLTIDEMEELIRLTDLYGSDLGKLTFVLDRRAR